MCCLLFLIFNFFTTIRCEQDDEFALCGGWCCGLSKEHIEAFIYWAIMCWARSRRKSGRGDISYRKYRPLRANGALQEEEAAAEAKHAQDMADREASEQEPAWLAARREAEAKREADAKREAAARGAGAQTEGGKGTPTTTAAGKKKKRAVSGQQQPVNRKNNSAAAARAAQQLANTRHILHRRELNSESESSSSSDEEEYMLQSAPADKGVEKGTWFSPSRWGSFGR